MGIIDRVFYGKFKPMESLFTFDKELIEVRETLVGIEEELDEIKEVIDFFERALDIAKRAHPGMYPTYTGMELPDKLVADLKRANQNKKLRAAWTIAFLSREEIALMKIMFEDVWFGAIDDHLQQPAEVILRRVVDKNMIAKEAKSWFKEVKEERRRIALKRYLRVLDKRNALYERAKAVMKRIYKGELNPLLGEKIFPGKQKKIDDRYNH